MQKKMLSNKTDFSSCSKEELLNIIQELQQENASLLNKYQAQSLVVAENKKMSFRQNYAEKILDALPDMLTVITDNGMTVAIVSSEDTNHTGIPNDEIFGVPVKSFLPDHVYSHVMQSIDEAIKYGKSCNLNHLMYVDGKAHYFENRTVRIAEDYNLCLCRDVTEEMTAKIQLESLSYAVNQVSENIFSLNPAGEFLFANKQFLKEHQQKNVIGKSAIGIMFSCRMQEDWEQLKQQIYTNNGIVSYSYEYQHPDESRISYEVVTHLVRNINNDEEFWFFARNTTYRKQQEIKIQGLNDLMNAILSNIPVYLFVKDSTDSRYLYWNKALEERTGISADMVIGHTDDEVFKDLADMEALRKVERNLLERNSRIESIEDFPYTKGDNTIIKAVRTLVERHDAKPLIIGVALDITDIKIVEKELISAKIEAEKSNQLKSAFLANMSHEIRTPLNAIVGFSKLMMTEDDLGTQQEYSDIIDSNADLLLQLINDILDLSKIEAGTLDFVVKDINLDTLFSDMQEVHRLKVSKDVLLIYEGTSDDLIIESDRNRLAQVLTNLLSNAIKFTTSGEIRFGYSVKGESVEVFVRDTGIGITPEKLSSIFDRFVKLNNFVAGTGLGLSITRTIIERLGGVISVESQEGIGTEFRFTLPYKNILKKGEKINTNQTELSVAGCDVAPQGVVRKTILIAEDNDSNYLLLKNFLGKKYHHYRAYNGLEAVEMFKEYAPNLIFMDIKMPVMNGLEATRIIRMQSTEVPIVALTAFAYESDKESALEAGVDHFLTKPISFTQIQSMLDKFLG